MGATRIIEGVSQVRYQTWIGRCQRRINPHALFRLSEAQRKVFKEEELIQILTKEKPVFVGMQKNGRYATFFRKGKGYTRIIFQVHEKGIIEIGTFYDVDRLPVLQDDK